MSVIILLDEGEEAWPVLGQRADMNLAGIELCAVR
jgi:hypothetical protein